ncbi:MAG: hypothetical protein E5V25_15005 [Mesorhizobium sp.]|nr:MAG: hypothetical protein E5V25_15005 [Mesorhizobium sp.]
MKQLFGSHARNFFRRTTGGLTSLNTYYLRAESQLNLYTKEGLERSGEISRQGLQVFPGFPLLTVELGVVSLVKSRAALQL